MHLLLRAVCLLLTAGCSAVGVGHSASNAPVAFLTHDITAGLQCEPATGLLGCLRVHERLQTLPAAPDATRLGERLCLDIQSGRTCFDDGGGLAYVLLGREKGQYVLVETEATGGYSVILMDASTGAQQRVDNRPLQSSDPDVFATVSYDTDAGYVPNRVAVWRAGLPEPVYVFDGFAPGEGPTGIRWRGPSTLEVRYSRQPFSPGPEGARTFQVWKDAKGVWENDYTR
jgi:hypothetical protein